MLGQVRLIVQTTRWLLDSRIIGFWDIGADKDGVQIAVFREREPVKQGEYRAKAMGRDSISEGLDRDIRRRAGDRLIHTSPGRVTCESASSFPNGQSREK